MARLQKVTHDLVQDFWEDQVCGTHFADDDKFSDGYFGQIEEKRYQLEPFIHSFAQFTRYRNKKVLEVGVGAGTDFVQWARAGARVHGVDLTEESIIHVQQRLKLEGLDVVDLYQGDAEHLKYEDNSFDLVYSWGVIHHSPDCFQALKEIVRVVKPGGQIRVMVYHRYSVAAFMTWFRNCLLRGHPFHSIAYAVANFVESPGTKAYTQAEMEQMASQLTLEKIDIQTILSWCDLALTSEHRFVRVLYRLLSWMGGGNRVGWFMLVKAQKSS